MNLVERAIPRPDLDEQVAGICEGQRYLHALGITGWQEAIVGDYAVIPDCFDAYLEAERRGLLTARVVGALWWQRETGIGRLDGLAERRDRAERAAGPGGGRFRATSVKIMQDGVCENFTASMLTPYLDAHGRETSRAGASFFDPQELKAAVTAIDAGASRFISTPSGTARSGRRSTRCRPPAAPTGPATGGTTFRICRLSTPATCPGSGTLR
jgi:hypothetical protein